MKESYYFSHDYHARHDGKMVKLFMRQGIKGFGLYWCLIEMLYEENGYVMLSECERIAFELREDISVINSVLIDFDLFKKDDKRFWSESVLRRIYEIKSKSISASKSANIRWGNMRTQSESDANALRTQYEGNAIKERKGKESKGKETNGSVEESFFMKMLKLWEKKKPEYPIDLKLDIQALRGIESFIRGQIIKLKNLTPDGQILPVIATDHEIFEYWKKVIENILAHEFYKDKPLSTISNKIQEFVLPPKKKEDKPAKFEAQIPDLKP